MGDYANLVRSFLTEYQRNCNRREHESIINTLWYHYLQSGQTENAAIKEKSRSLEQIMQLLPHKRKNELYRAVMELCLEHEHTAFLSGVRMGIHLVLECFNEE